MKFHFEDKYKKAGMTAFLVIAASILFFFAIFRYDGLMQALDGMNTIMKPIIVGLVMAYLMCPLYNFILRHCMKFRWTSSRSEAICKWISKAIATIAVIVVIVGAVAGFLWIVIPQMIESIIAIAGAAPTSMNELVAWITNIFEDMPQITGPVEVWLNQATEQFTQWVENILVPEYTAVISGLSTGLFGIITTIMNFIIGLVVCVFFINRKDIFASQIKKISFALLKPEKADSFLRGSAYVNKTFGAYINGKIIESLLVGLITFIFMTLVGWPYAALISLIIGVTDIIPFFGPYIGTIPSALLLLMVDPKICLYFVIFIIVLQTFDGYLLGPKILGDSTGLPTFWVLFAILVGGGIFGFLGMVVGVPVFAVLYAYAAYFVNKRLEKKGLSVNLEDYQTLYKPKNPRSNEKENVHE